MKISKTFDSVYQFIFADVRMSWLWLVVRLYLGYEWLMAGYEKFINPVWVGDKAGVAISGFVNGALAKTVGIHPDVSGWYAWFLEHAVLTHPVAWSYAITYGEIFVGLGLILGLFTVTASFFGFFMNTNYLLAGTVSTNPILLVLALLIMLAHKTAGYIGVDRFLIRKNPQS